MNNTSSNNNIDIKYKYNKLKLAQDLTQTVLNTIGIQLTKLNKETGIFDKPTNEQVCTYLNKLAERKEIPHYTLQNKEGFVYLFDKNELLNWIEKQLQQVHSIKTHVVPIKVEDTEVDDTEDVPNEICQIQSLYKLPDYTIYSGSCVYFLCRDNKVVYVGQTLNVYSRVFTHKQENRKLFDEVYYIRVPHKQLDNTEKALIRYLNPEYNVQKYRIAGLKESDIIEKIYKT